MSRQAFTLESAVGSEGKIEIKVQLPTGTKVQILVLAPLEDPFDDLRQVASIDFWDNPQDDEAWNNA